jgi:hypothetical protein
VDNLPVLGKPPSWRPAARRPIAILDLGKEGQIALERERNL